MSLKILLATSEMVPYAKTGGLADVAGALPKRLKARGHDVRTFLPLYRAVTSAGRKLDYVADFPVTLGGQTETAILKQDPESSFPAYFIGSHRHFDRPALYGESGVDYPDNARRFAFFCSAVAQATQSMGWTPDVIHANDWQTALLPTYLRTMIPASNPLAGAASLFTVHNIAYQGLFEPQVCPEIGLDLSLFTPDKLEFWGKLNLLKAGLIYSDVLTTVSPTYAREIQDAEFGYGLEGVLQERQRDVYGVLNGADYDEWNPEHDSHLWGLSYSASSVKGKQKVRAKLLASLGLDAKDTVPVIGMVTRLADQKGLDLVAAVLDRIMGLDVALVVLGTGEPKYHDLLTRMAKEHPSRVSVHLKFDNTLAHRIEGGSDIFLMPSRYEPCGLNQIYSLRYGTVPVVRRTGGLADTITDAVKDPTRGTGFVFDAYAPEALLASVKAAVTAFREPKRWARIVASGMKSDFSWEASARRYEELYEVARKKAAARNTRAPARAGSGNAAGATGR